MHLVTSSFDSGHYLSISLSSLLSECWSSERQHHKCTFCLQPIFVFYHKHQSKSSTTYIIRDDVSTVSHSNRDRWGECHRASGGGWTRLRLHLCTSGPLGAAWQKEKEKVKNGNFCLSFSHNPVYKHVTGNGCQHIQTVKHLLKYLLTYSFSFPQNLEESPRLFLTNDKCCFFPHPTHFWNGRNSQIRLTVWRYDEKEGLSWTVRLLLTCQLILSWKSESHTHTHLHLSTAASKLRGNSSNKESSYCWSRGFAKQDVAFISRSFCVCVCVCMCVAHG